MAWNLANWYFIYFGCTGAPTANHFPIPSAGPTSANEIAIAVPAVVAITEMRVICTTAPGGVIVDTFTVRLGGVGSAAVATVTAAAVTGTWSGNVAVAADDIISVQYTQSAASAIQNVMIALTILNQD